MAVKNKPTPPQYVMVGGGMVHYCLPRHDARVRFLAWESVCGAGLFGAGDDWEVMPPLEVDELCGGCRQYKQRTRRQIAQERNR